MLEHHCADDSKDLKAHKTSLAPNLRQRQNQQQHINFANPTFPQLESIIMGSIFSSSYASTDDSKDFKVLKASPAPKSRERQNQQQHINSANPISPRLKPISMGSGLSKCHAKESTLPFFSLPREIRDIIYEYCLTDHISDSAIPSTIAARQPPEEMVTQVLQGENWFLRGRHCIDWLRASRQMRSEGLETLQRMLAVTWVVQTPEELASIRNCYIDEDICVQHLVLYQDIFECCVQELVKALKTFSSLKSIEIVFKTYPIHGLPLEDMVAVVLDGCTSIKSLELTEPHSCLLPPSSYKHTCCLGHTCPGPSSCSGRYSFCLACLCDKDALVVREIQEQIDKRLAERQ